MTQENKRLLLPIGTRVGHFGGGPGTHGIGTIIAYNGVSPNNYIKTNFKEAVNLAAEVGLLGGLVNAMYDGGRYPYVVQFDPRPLREDATERDKEIRRDYPRGYKDTYGDEMTPLMPNENIFPDDEAMYMARCWHEKLQEWGQWEVISAETYAVIGPGLGNNSEWQCCARMGEIVHA